MSVKLFLVLVALVACQTLAQDCVPLRCTLPLNPGTCTDTILQWYYDTASSQCLEFFYTGCGGNVNRFRNKNLCENTCMKGCPTPTTTTTTTRRPTTTTRRTTTTTRRPTTAPPTTPSPLPPRCTLAVDPGPCAAVIQRYYYDTVSGQCKTFTYGGCEGNLNNFGSLELCETTCVDV